MDAFLVKRIVDELSEGLRGALVSKVHQPAEREIVLSFWTGREEKRLLLSARPEMCRIHLTTRRAANPATPPPFCQFLRRHLEGMRLAGASVAPFDRLVRLDFASSRPDALHERTSLYAELYGRHANLIYVREDGVILAPLREVPPEESRIRELRPGIPYVPLPRPARIFLPDVTPADAERFVATAWEGLPRLLQREVAGLGQELALEAAGRGGGSGAALHAALAGLARRYGTAGAEAGIGTLPSGKTRILPFPCPAAGFAGFAPFPSANDAADAFYGAEAEARELAVFRQQLRSKIAALLRKERRTLENVEGDEARLVEGLKGRERGETLKENLPALRKGMSEFRGIPLDPSRSPVENMTRCFNLHKKARRAEKVVRDRMREVAEAVYFLESLETELEGAGTHEALAGVRQELFLAFPPRAKAPGRGKRPAAASSRQPVAPQVETIGVRGYTVLLGRNNAGNDRIVRELSAPGDLWLHAQGIPGSHVLVKRPAGKEVPPEVVEEAARLAVLHSRAKGASNVPVFLAEARHVSKFKGAKPGLVRIARYETINVR